MWELIVMGQIPGTSIQVNFVTWLFIIASLLLVTLAFKTVRSALSQEAQTKAIPVIAIASPGRVKHKSLRLTTKLLLAYRLRRTIQTTAYSRWLIARQQLRA